MKLIRIVSNSENTIDEAIVLVPDDYNAKELLKDADENGIDNPSIENIIDVDEEEVSGLAEYRFYIG